ncbi:MAG: toll/interleukin-1 receptor domain-containing protein [Bryobacteraceae bacterium]
MPKYEFFLSHKSDDWDEYMEAFLEDVSDGVGRRRKRSKQEEFVFLDKGEIELGQNWLPRLLDGLQHSGVLLCMYTPRYFASDWCGREVAYFERRHEQAPGIKHPCVIPVLWDIPLDEIPRAMGSVQYNHKSLPEAYAEEGMLALVRRREGRYRDEYVDAVDALVDAIVKACEQDLGEIAPEPTTAELAAIPSFFKPQPKPAENGRAAPPAPAARVPAGPSTVHFYYMAAARGDLAPGKPHLEYYHPNGGPFWRPWPDGQQIKALAAAVAGSKDLNLAYYDQPVDETLEDQLEKARDSNNMVVVFADAWSIHLLPQFRDYAHTYDRNLDYNSSLIVVWNEGDPDLNDGARQMLTGTVTQVLRLASTRQEPFFLPRVEGEAGVRARLRESLERLMQKITETAPPNRAPQAMAKPVLPVHSGGG